MKQITRILLLVFILCLTFCCGAASSLPAGLKALKHVKADKWNIVGNNYVVSGNVLIKYEDMVLRCDKAILNTALQDIEASGKCSFVKWKKTQLNIAVDALAKLEKRSDVRISVTGITGDVFGKRQLSVQAEYISELIQCRRIVGNLKSGYFRFDGLNLKTTSIVCRADSGERFPNGVLELRNGEVSSCAYLASDNAHYSIGASKIRLTPNKSEFYGAGHIERDFDEHIVTMWHGIAKIYGFPVFYFPYVWKPRDENPGFFSFKWGKNSDWGYFFSGYKKFTFSEYPLSQVRIRADWYTLRGVGYGASGRFVTENSRTDFFAYGLYDIRPYESDDYDDYRLKVPHARFNLRLSNLTHITPRLDFRGVAEYSSDRYFVRDFFNDRFTGDPEPATFAALEQQFDHFTAAAYFRMRLMDSFTTVEKLPELLLLGQRQQILDTPFYYQGEMSAGYYRMKWIDFDKKLSGYQGSKLKDYDAFRFDTTHFLYLPLRTPYFVLTPRAGFRMTAYSQTSDRKVRESDLLKMFSASSPTNMRGVDFTNYDDDGGSKLRWIGELGVELSTKIHNTWGNLRNMVLRLDGLRHIMRPYANYTFISSPTLSKDHIYYFDEVDRIDKQSFFRFGLENRLQTRSGSSLRDWLRLENFIDIHTSEKDGLSAVGDFCTLLSVEPIKGLTLSTELMVDAGGNNDDLPDHYRHERNVGRPGIDLKWINRWNVSIKYAPVEDIVFSFSYDYIRPYNGRNPYSMGSTLTLIESSRWFSKSWYKHSETFSFGVQMPITPDRRTFAAFNMGYDFLEGHVSSYRLILRRLFHCLELSAELAFEHNTDRDDPNWDTSFSVGVKFTGLESPVLQTANPVLTSAAAGSKGFSL